MPTRLVKNRADEILARDVLISEMQGQIEQLKQATIKTNEKYQAEMSRQKSYTIELENRLEESTQQLFSFWESVPDDMVSVVKGLLEEAEPQRSESQNEPGPGLDSNGAEPSNQHYEIRKNEFRRGVLGQDLRGTFRPQSAPPLLGEVGTENAYHSGSSMHLSRSRRSSMRLRTPNGLHSLSQKRALSPVSPSSNDSASLQSEWLSAFTQLLDSAGLPPSRNEGVEVLKCREKVRIEVERLMTVPDRPSKTFMGIVDSSDPLVRSHWLDEVAIHFRVVGMLLKVMHSMQTLSWSVLDAKSSYEVFVNEIKKILSPDSSDLWLVNQGRERIWKWDPDQQNPRHHAFIATLPGQETVMTNVGKPFDSVAKPAEQAKVYFDAETNRFQPSKEVMNQDDFQNSNQISNPERYICEPIYFDKSIVAVIQCRNSERKFAPWDQTFLKLLAKYSGFLFRRIALFENNIRMVESTMNNISLTRLYPSDESDIFAVARVQLDHARVLLSAGQCVLYLVTREDSPEASGLKMWTHRVDGLCTRIEFRLGGTENTIVGWVAEHEELVLLDHPDEDSRFNYEIDTARSAKSVQNRQRIHSLLAMPIKMPDTSLFGVCVMLNKRGSSFTQSDSRVLGLVCEQLVLGLTLDGSEPVAMPQESLQEALNRSRMLLTCARVALFRVNRAKNKLVLHNVPPPPGDGQREDGEVTVPLCDDMVGYVARTGVPIRVRDAAAEPRFNPDLSLALHTQIACFMCIPVHSLENPTIVAGVILCVNKLGAPDFNEEDEAIAKMLAKQIMRIDSAVREDGGQAAAAAAALHRCASELQEEPTHT